MTLNFGTLATTQTSSSNLHLRPYNIYEGVKFAGIEGPITGTSAQGNSWKAWDFKFECSEGTYSERIFDPSIGKGAERNEVKRNDGTVAKLPSDWERTQAFLAQVGHTYNPEGFAKVQENAGKVSSFEQLIELFKKCIGQPTVTTNLKLTGRNNNGSVYASLPTFVRINSSTGEVFTSDNFLGDKVAFSSWEKSKKTEYENAKPTNVAATTSISVDTSAKSDDFDLESLGL